MISQTTSRGADLGPILPLYATRAVDCRNKQIIKVNRLYQRLHSLTKSLAARAGFEPAMYFPSNIKRV